MNYFLNSNKHDVFFRRTMKGGQLFRHLPAACCLLAITACATFPQQAKIAQFGDAAAVLGASVEQAYVSHLLLRNALGDDDAAIEYLSDESFTFPPVSTDQIVNRELWNSRSDAMRAVQDYASELAKISEPGAAARVSASAVRLSSAVVDLGRVLSSSDSLGANVIPSTLGALVRAGVEGVIARRVRTKMKETQPYIDLLSEALAKDVAGLEALAGSDLDVVKANQKAALRAIRRDNRVNRAALYQRYYKSLRLYEDREDLIGIYATIPIALANFADAHKAMADSSDDDRAFEEFLKLSNQLRVLAQQIKSR